VALMPRSSTLSGCDFNFCSSVTFEPRPVFRLRRRSAAGRALKAKTAAWSTTWILISPRRAPAGPHRLGHKTDRRGAGIVPLHPRCSGNAERRACVPTCASERRVHTRHVDLHIVCQGTGASIPHGLRPPPICELRPCSSRNPRQRADGNTHARSLPSRFGSVVFHFHSRDQSGAPSRTRERARVRT
jgi:hypothetical protein